MSQSEQKRRGNFANLEEENSFELVHKGLFSKLKSPVSKGEEKLREGGPAKAGRIATRWSRKTTPTEE